MPFQPIELITLFLGIFLLIIPGYLWSFLFSKQLTKPERIIFGFLVGLGITSCGSYFCNIFFHISITQQLIWILFFIYTIPIVIIYSISLIRLGPPKITWKYIYSKKTLLLGAILLFSFLMMFLPHLDNGYFLPFHVDEWIHWEYTDALMKTGSTSFINPYTGSGVISNPEIGFHLTAASLKWLSNTTFLTLFLFMPAILGTFLSLLAYNIGQRSERKFGFEAAFLTAFIPTTCRFLGPSFFVAVTFGLILLLFCIWLAQTKQLQFLILLFPFLMYLFIVHPPTAFAAALVLATFIIFYLLEKQWKPAVVIAGILCIPAILFIMVSTRWEDPMSWLIEAAYGEEYLLGLPKIWVSFEHIGLITWGLFVIGVYFAVTRGKILERTMVLSSMLFLIVIGLYDRYQYGVPIIYERMFLYLFLMVSIIAGFALRELRNIMISLPEMERFKQKRKLLKKVGAIFPFAVSFLLIGMSIPAHLDIGYYQLITEDDFEGFVWIRDHIGEYRNDTFLYDRGAVDPFKASPFSAITGLYIVSSRVHPLYGFSLYPDMERFLENNCADTSFLDRYNIGVVYGNCSNNNLTKIYENVYIYPGLYTSK